MRFSIIVVALNAGEKLNRTLDSVLCQTCTDYEIVVKDGGSRDGSVENMRADERVRLYSEPDTGIYDAMNQAVSYAQGDYLLFLNCGDVLFDETVLERTLEAIDSTRQEKGETTSAGGTDAADHSIFYGDTYGSKNGVLITAPPAIDGFACYRNIPCHQSCFYEASLCKNRQYEPKYRIRADYDHFLWCYYQANAKMVYLHMTVSAYEGGGYSESRENRRRDREEHREITKRYMRPGELRRYRAAMLLTLAPLRRFLAENRMFSGMYHKIKTLLYK